MASIAPVCAHSIDDTSDTHVSAICVVDSVNGDLGSLSSPYSGCNTVPYNFSSMVTVLHSPTLNCRELFCWLPATDAVFVFIPKLVECSGQWRKRTDKWYGSVAPPPPPSPPPPPPLLLLFALPPSCCCWVVAISNHAGWGSSDAADVLIHSSKLAPIIVSDGTNFGHDPVFKLSYIPT